MQSKSITLTVHGLDRQKDAVDARVFALKLGQFVRALARSDKARHGKSCLEFVITNLKTGSATAQLTERQSHSSRPPSYSSIDDIHATMALVYEGRTINVGDYGDLLLPLKAFSAGASKSFSYMEVYIDDEPKTAIRVDPFFFSKVTEALARRATLFEEQKTRYYRGTSHGSFDGELQLVDIRGAVKLAKLTLTAGRKEIDCTCNDLSILSRGLGRRARVKGLAHYDGRSAFPVRLDIRDVAPTKSSPDLMRWKGAFDIAHTDADGWGEE